MNPDERSMTVNKATELKTTTELVKDILEHDEKARNSDDYLYYMVCREKNSGCVYLPFWMVILNRKQYNIPAFESVRRSRQKIQAENPELAGVEEVEAQRTVNETVFRDYARGHS